MEINIKDGYKVTEVGVIPDDWEVKKLGDIANIQRGASPRPIDSPIWYDITSSVGWVRISDITASNGRILQKTKDYLSQQGIAQSRFLPAGSLIMSICATVGIPVITNIDTCIHDGFVGFTKLNYIDKVFFYYKLKELENNFKSMGQTGSQNNLNTNLVKKYPIPLPPLAEQKAIAHALSDVDNLITAIDQLITKKRNLKQGTMQELLTGKKRLPGFSGKWEVKKVGDICDFIVPGRNKPKKFEGHIPWITTPDLEDGRSIYKSRLDLCISIDEAKNVGSKIVPAGSIIMSCAGELGITALTENEIVINQQLHAFIPSSIIDGWFLLNIIKRQKKYINSIATKTAVPYINKDNCNSIPIPLPPLPEQKAIAEILTDIDKEIEALEKKRDKYKAIKQGMMQELLTGKTRIIDN